MGMSIKAKVKDKIAKVKAKVKGKTKRTAKLAALGVALTALCGCPSASPASRATTATVEDPRICVDIGNGTTNVAVTAYIHIHDLALASADSSGSTETQTATPSVSIPIKIDARYNDALAAASATSRSVLGTIGDGLGAVLDMMVSGKSGKVKVVKTDGTPATVQCDGGQCSWTDDGSTTEDVD